MPDQGILYSELWLNPRDLLLYFANIANNLWLQFLTQTGQFQEGHIVILGQGIQILVEFADLAISDSHQFVNAPQCFLKIVQPVKDHFVPLLA